MSFTTDHTPTTESVLGAGQTLAAAFAAGDVAALVAAFDPHGLLKLRDQPIATGRVEIGVVWRAALGRAGFRSLELHPAEVTITGDGDRRREMGVYALDIATDDGFVLVESTYTITSDLGDGEPRIAMARFD
ncbi:MAG: hypothetical protein AAGG08_21645 [Actinomycetota bacterium]